MRERQEEFGFYLGGFMEAVFGIAFGVVVVSVLVVIPIVVTGLKGKYGMIVLGLFVHPCWWFAAIRLAKPESFWARRYYDPQTVAYARARFPG